MIVSPSVQSFAVMPSMKDYAKSTKAHEYLRQNQHYLNLLINTDNIHIPQKTNFMLKITIDGINTADGILDFFFNWNILDVLEIKPANMPNYFHIYVRSPSSACVISKLPGVKVLISDIIPPCEMVPLVYVQGIPKDETDDNIRSFFKGISPILTIYRIIRENFYGFILETTSTKAAINLAEKSNNEKYGLSKLSVSIQYHNSVTNSFFINSLTAAYPIEVARYEIAKFGPIKYISNATVSGLPSIIVKMEKIEDARLACGFLNNTTYLSNTLNSIFIEENHFDLLYNRFYSV
ncbi:hypothetical protein TVAG_393910 [Trichomonas vaginalis G3]|uniref:RRM domain-containing protein n=1 Tax=Trichomonas vaginalis (strain ATCC PRA-98 / G3) TaxID=412133 RepID=A2DWA8_TRIV3|nr:RNA-binding domain, RBD family-containing protein [Trichomonas vaginalis G3]EAY15248.1 hypothetical protein TVAG_393910 [Trichomonas vaginalis G3]KAI5526448.1 RNA-binding domain, RBD family-containing protein [Trichomonas vaginalis G3]|eukprot:XP_001327471.1 hypothetical protein [Trichomonas vaginalis G3]